ncbi:hypothetical protein [Candidatus Poriferisodalis sp.]|uniref:hypothetical protein n=1 Tax=Candidatus Poriferisodalis sp. TaxID=3101277 RepID=UPI003B017C3A
MKPAAKMAVALFTALAMALGLLAPAAAQTPSNFVRGGPNLTLVVASCPVPSDNAIAEALAAHSRNAAKVCVDPSGLSPETAALIAEFAPDRLIVVGGEVAVPPAVMDELTAAARAAFRWTAIERLGGATRIETAALAARAALESPSVTGPGTVTLYVANGWNGSEVRTAAAAAGVTDDAAVVYVQPRTIAGGLPAATASLIADYRPARVVLVGLPDEVGAVTETAVAAALDANELTVEIERVAEAGEPLFWTPEASPSVSTARQIFTAIVQGTQVRGAAGDDPVPVLAASSARGPLEEGPGHRLWSVQADGSGRELRSGDHRGWAWNPGSGELSWANLDGRLRVSALTGDERVVSETGQYPTWSPDGSHVVTFRFAGRTAFRSRTEAHIASADGRGLQRIGVVDYRTFLYADLPLASWSPDGTHFAYVELIDDPATGGTAQFARIWSTDESALALTLGEDVTFLGWSPDSAHFAYATPHDCDGNGRDESQILWIAKTDGSEPRELGPIDRIQWRFVHLWSADGRHLAYESLDPADCSMHLKVAAASGEATALGAVADGRLVGWSPNGNHLAYGLTVGTPGKGVPLREHVWVVRNDGSDRRDLGEALPTVFGPVRWSRDGQHLAYAAVVRDADGEVIGSRPVVTRANGIGGVVQLAEWGNILEWSPVDDRLAYVAHYNEYGDREIDRRALFVHTVGSAAADVRLVYELAGITLGARWSPDGAYLGYVSGPTELLLDWFINRRRGSDAWVVRTTDPRWTRRLITDVTWGEWQPR